MKNHKVILTNVYITNQPGNSMDGHNNTTRDLGANTGGLLSKRKSLSKK